jgi:hypothetical protein
MFVAVCLNVLRTQMRPNIDISYTLNGRVKDYADQQDLSLDDAYCEIIEAGLDTVEHPDES